MDDERQPAWARLGDDEVELTLHVQPGARRSAVVGADERGLRVRIAAPAHEGKANAELVRYLAAILGVPRRRVVLRHGSSSRTKTVVVRGPVDLDRLRPPD